MDANEATLQKKKELDAMLAKAMAQLSFKARQMDMEELHGVPDKSLGYAENTEACLLDLEDHLTKFKAGTAFEIAEEMDASYMNDGAMKLRFLRGNRYDTKTTAKKMIKFYELKKRLFGKDKLTSDIQQSDLNEEDMACLRNGSFQMLPEDRAKRLILLNFPCFRAFKDPKSELRARFYFYSRLLEMPAMEERGLVVVTYCCGSFRDSMNGDGFVENTEMGVLFPIHFAAMHYCTSSVAESIVVSSVLAVIPDRWRSRFKFHVGSHTEVQYLLSTFGIPRSILPLTADNVAILDQHLACLERFQIEEESKNPSSHTQDVATLKRPPSPLEDSCPLETETVILKGEPGPMDVLFGRNKSTQPGNATLRQMVDAMLDGYDAANKTEKIEMSTQVLSKIKALGGRFLKEGETNGTWQIVSEMESREKVAQAFRNSRRVRAKQSDQDKKDLFSTSSLREIEVVGPNDVVFGGAKQQSSAGGNTRMRQLVRDMAKKYDTASNEQKKVISDYIVQTIKGEGGRFLKRKHNGRFEEVSDLFARSRVSKRFCNSRRSQRP